MNTPNLYPPKWADRLLIWLCKEEVVDIVQGDLYEIYYRHLEKYSKKKADRLYVRDVFQLIKPRLIKPLEGNNRLNQYGLFKNYIKVAFRILAKEKIFASINISGLALAMVCSLFIYLWVQDEMGINNHLKSGDRVCQVLINTKMSDGKISLHKRAPYNLKKVLEENYQSIDQVAITSVGNWTAFENEQSLLPMAGIDASPEFFEMFEISFLKGSYQNMFDNPQTIAISESFADSYFGEEWKTSNVIGQILVNEWGGKYKLVGIYVNLPGKSTMTADFVIPFEDRLNLYPWYRDWQVQPCITYVKLSDDSAIGETNHSIKNAINSHCSQGANANREISLQPFSDTYLYSQYEIGKISGGRIEYVKLLSFVALLIILLAAINFMNLAVARSSKRAKETGVRKVFGAFRFNLQSQFLTESVLITFFAFVMSLMLMYLFLPHFNAITGKNVSLIFFTWEFIFSTMGFMLLLGLISGAYPAFHISVMNTVASLKGRYMHSKIDATFRKGLVVFQFVITIIMITSSIAIYRQVDFIQGKNLGIDRSNMIRFFGNEISGESNYEAFKTELMKRPGIESVTTLDQNMFKPSFFDSDLIWNGQVEGERVEFTLLRTTPDFIPTMKIELIEGRNFDWKIQSDSASFIINETAQRMMRMNSPLDMNLEVWGIKGKIIGVAEDFHNASLHTPIQPMVIRFDRSENYQILTRIKPEKIWQAVRSIEEVFLMFNPKREFQFEYLDSVYNEEYRSELMVKDLLFYFTILAIVISCLGLFASVMYNVEQRTKEIGIRKVMGASVTKILQLLSQEYVLLLSISIVVAIPLAYYLISIWLEGYAYRINLSWWSFAIAATIPIFISYFIIGTQAFRSTMVNPVDSLRSE